MSATVPSVSGALMLDQVRCAEEMLGADVVARAIASMPQAERDELDALLPISWVSLTCAMEFNRAVARTIGEAPDVWHRRIVEVGMERSFTTIWRFFLRLTSLDAILKRTAVVYAKSYNRGALSSERIDADTIAFTLDKWPDVPEWELHALEVALESIARLAGRTAKVSRARYANGARFLVRLVA